MHNEFGQMTKDEAIHLIKEKKKNIVSKVISTGLVPIIINCCTFDRKKKNNEQFKHTSRTEITQFHSNSLTKEKK